MALDASNLDVWLDTRPEAGQALIVPYARSAREITATYVLRVRNSGRDGNARITQRGTLTLEAERPRALTRIKLHLHPADDCRIELSLMEDDTVLGRYAFRCGESP